MELRRISVAKIYDLILDVFIGLGIPADDAKICAGVLIESDLRGIESHGVGRLKMYYDRIIDGIIDPITEITKIQQKTRTFTNNIRKITKLRKITQHHENWKNHERSKTQTLNPRP